MVSRCGRPARSRHARSPRLTSHRPVESSSAASPLTCSEAGCSPAGLVCSRLRRLPRIPRTPSTSAPPFFWPARYELPVVQVHVDALRDAEVFAGARLSWPRYAAPAFVEVRVRDHDRTAVSGMWNSLDGFHTRGSRFFRLKPATTSTVGPQRFRGFRPPLRRLLAKTAGFAPGGTNKNGHRTVAYHPIALGASANTGPVIFAIVRLLGGKVALTTSAPAASLPAAGRRPVPPARPSTPVPSSAPGPGS